MISEDTHTTQTDQLTFQDPVARYPVISPPEQTQEEPGLRAQMTAQPDLGEFSYRGTGRLQGRKALVTGGDSGIETAVAVAFAKEGADVAINYLPDEAYQPSPPLLDYASTKAAINNFSKGLAQELAPKGIRVSAVEVGPIWTPIQPSQGQPVEELPEFGQSTPLGRAGQPTEVAPAFVFLASPESSSVLGETLHVNGGMPSPTLPAGSERDCCAVAAGRAV